VAEMQKTETKNSKAKDVFEKVKTDIRLMKEELNLIERYIYPKHDSCLKGYYQPSMFMREKLLIINQWEFSVDQ
jgi:hypothetical protein